MGSPYLFKYLVYFREATKQILSNCWTGILNVLSVLLNGKSNVGSPYLLKYFVYFREAAI